jgi:hypothetical protein
MENSAMNQEKSDLYEGPAQKPSSSWFSYVLQSRLLMRMKFGLLRAWQILRDVLRGYFSGQPPGDSRPRKGCC